MRQVFPYDGVGEDHPRPVIYAKETCHGTTRDMAQVDELIVALVVGRLAAPNAADLLIRDEKRDDISELRDRAAALRARQDEAAGLFADGTVNASKLRIVNTKLAA